MTLCILYRKSTAGCKSICITLRFNDDDYLGNQQWWSFHLYKALYIASNINRMMNYLYVKCMHVMFVRGYRLVTGLRMIGVVGVNSVILYVYLKLLVFSGLTRPPIFIDALLNHSLDFLYVSHSLSL